MLFCVSSVFFVNEVIANFMLYVKLRLRAKTTYVQKVRVKFRQFLRSRLIVYIVCTQATGFTTKVAVFVCVTLKCDNFNKFQHLV